MNGPLHLDSGQGIADLVVLGSQVHPGTVPEFFGTQVKLFMHFCVRGRRTASPQQARETFPITFFFGTTMQRTLLVILMMAVSIISAQAITLEEILTKYYEAKGGLKTMKALTSMRSTGTMSMSMMGGIEMKIKQSIRRGNRMRAETEVQGMNIVIGFDGEKAWMVNPMMGTEPQVMDADQSAEYAMQADLDGELVDWKDKGHAVEYIGTADVDGSTAYKVKLTTKKGDVRMYFLDAITFLELKVDSKSEQMGQAVDMETVMSNFQEVAGIQMPHQIETRSGGQVVMTMTIDKIEPNVTLEDSLFALPK